MKILPTKVLNKAIIQLGEDSNAVNCTFHKTLRVPDDGKIYPLPPSLGTFPIYKVDDFKSTVPKKWLKTGGVFMPMMAREALWIQFTLNSTKNNEWKPKALKIACGKVNAIDGKPWKNELSRKQDYAVIPSQKWIDGINSGSGKINQFIAMEMGGGYTIEGQVTGKEEHGGLQLLMYDSKSPKKNPQKKVKKDNPWMPEPIDDPFFPYPINLDHGKKKKKKPKPYPIYPPINPIPVVPMSQISVPSNTHICCESSDMSEMSYKPSTRSINGNNKKKNMIIEDQDDEESSYGNEKEIGIAIGGKMKQKIVKDKYGFDSWNQNKFARVFIHIVNNAMWEKITGEKAPKPVITKQTYKSYNFPWFDLYEEDFKDVKGSKVLKKLKTVKEKDNEKYVWPQQDDKTIKIDNVIVIKDENQEDPNEVRDGDW